MAARPSYGKSGQMFVAGGMRFKLGGVIGDGAIGVVRRAIDDETNREFAVKFLSPEPRYVEHASLPDIEARFRREGNRGLSLQHPNLVKIVAYEDNENGSCFQSRSAPVVPFIVMEYVRGQTLESFIKKNAIGPPFRIDEITLFIAHQIVDGLLYLHEKRLVHRDVKPANIFLSSATRNSKPSSIKLGDFGVCKWGDYKASVATGTLTVTGQRGLGTIKYMSPEQALTPKDVTVRADMYSLGITLFELFTSRILPSHHHVSQLTQVRMKRGSLIGKMMEIGLPMIPQGSEDLFEPVLDMLLMGPTGRPTSKFMLGRLEYLIGRLSY